MARPPSVMVLIDSPKYWNTSAVASSDTGIATSEMSGVRRLSRNRNRITATRMAPSRSASSTLPIEASMKSACLNRNCGASNPCGSPFDSSAIAFSTARVSVTLSALGCFCTDRMTAGLAVLHPDHEVLQILDARGAADLADQVLASLRLEKTAAGVGAEVLQRPV